MSEYKLIEQNKSNFDKVIEHLKTELEGIRTNRATPALIENIQVDIYGTKMPINQLASINVQDSKTMIVEAWDKPNVQALEKSIQTASLGLSVANEGTFLRVTIPHMTEETRKEILKILNDKLEKTKNSLRIVRDKVKNEINNQEKNKDITQDEKYQSIEKLNETIKEYNEKIKQLGEKKEQEIRL